MDLKIENFDRNCIIYEGVDMYFIAKGLGEFVGLVGDRLRYALNKLNEPSDKVCRTLTFKNHKGRHILLTPEGVRKLLMSVKQTDVTNINYIRTQFDELYVKYTNNLINEHKKETGCKLIDCDPSSYNGSCIYLIHIKENIYKIGETDNVKKRLESHKKEFNYENVCRIFTCPNKTVSQRAESDIKGLLNIHNYMYQYPKKNNPDKYHTEVFKTEDPIDLLIKKFSEIIDQRTREHINNEYMYVEDTINDSKNRLIGQNLENKSVELQMRSFSQESITPMLNQIFDRLSTLEKENTELKNKIILLENRVEFLENINPENKITVVREFNRKEQKIDIPLDRIQLYVQNNIKPMIGSSIGKKLLQDRLKKSDLSEFIDIDAETTREFRTILRGAIESIHGINTKGENKDMYYNCEINYVTAEEFINECCVIHPNAEESVSNINEAYINYCDSIQRSYPKDGMFSKLMNDLGYKSISGTSGYKYQGIYLKNNKVIEFIANRCEVGDAATHYCPLTQFVTNYHTYGVTEGFKKSQLHNKKAIKCILLQSGYELHEFGNKCYNIKGIKIIGQEYNRKGHAKTRGIPKPKVDEDIKN